MKKLNLKTENKELKPNSLVLWGKEVISGACNVYKLSLTEEQKAKHFLKYLQKTLLFAPKSVDYLYESYTYRTLLKNSDFYVFRIKPEIIEISKKIESKGGIVYLVDDLNRNGIYKEIVPFSNVDLFEFIRDYLTFKYNSENYVISENKNTQVILVRNWSFEEE